MAVSPAGLVLRSRQAQNQRALLTLWLLLSAASCARGSGTGDDVATREADSGLDANTPDRGLAADAAPRAVDGAPRAVDGAPRAVDGAPRNDAGTDTAMSEDGSMTGADVARDAGAPVTPCGGNGAACCAGFRCGAGAVCTGTKCATAVGPGSCTGSTSAAVFMSARPPPATMEPWQVALATLTFVNCSGQTWTSAAAGAPSGYKLGSVSPHDGQLWGPERIALPADVPSGSQVTIGIPLRAPPLTGGHRLSWAIVHEGVAWLEADSPEYMVNVQSRSAPATLCPGVMADIGGEASASAAIQRCIDAAPEGSSLLLPAGIYRVTAPIRIAKPLTIGTAGERMNPAGCLDPGGPRCVVLRADQNLVAPQGLLRVEVTHDVVLDHLVIDGNRGARLGSTAAAECASGKNRSGFNAATPGCTSCSFLRSASVRALCGTGFEWRGDNATIEGSVFLGNGDHNTKNMWADGLTIHQSDRARVRGCQFIDNSDIGFIIGGGIDAKIESNTVRQSGQSAFGGLMLDNFVGGTSGDFRGTTVTNNSVACHNLGCDFGIMLGPHAWYVSKNILGGTVTGNSVSGAKFQIMVEGGGTKAAPMVVSGNVIGSSPATGTFLCGQRPVSAYNISPDSVVDVGAGPGPTSTQEFHVCP